MDTMHVRITQGEYGPRKLHATRDDGSLILGSFVGIDANGNIDPAGFVVAKTSHWLRKLADGDIELVKAED